MLFRSLKRSILIARCLLVSLLFSTPVIAVAEKKASKRDFASKQRFDTNVNPTPVSNETELTKVESVETAASKTDLKVWSQPFIPKEIHDQKTLAPWSLLIEDKTLYRALGRWAATAGWQLIWDAERDFPVERSEEHTSELQSH